MSNELNLMPPMDDGGEQDLSEMLAKRTKQPRSKVTTALIVVVILLFGVFLGIPIGKATSSSSGRTGGLSGGSFPGAPSANATAAAPVGGASVGRLPSGGPGGFGGRGTAGTVKSVDGATLTVTTQDGGDVTVSTTEQTSITESTDVPLDQLKPGTTVVVMGEQQDDGSVAAQRIIAGQGGFGPGGGPGAPVQ